MTASTSGRYKSKTLSTATQATTRWIDQFERAVRHIKLAATWGTQLLLYPFYALFHGSRLIGKQLQQATRSMRLSLPTMPRSPQRPLATDTPIQNLLQAIELVVPASDDAGNLRLSEHLITIKPLAEVHKPASLRQFLSRIGRQVLKPFTLSYRLQRQAPEVSSLAGSTTPQALNGFHSDESLARPKLDIQGVASLIESRRLVLVAGCNQILDILTSTQQTQLYQRIVWEFADFKYHERQARLSTATNRMALSHRRDRTLQLPSHLRQRLDAWIEHRPGIQALNAGVQQALRSAQDMHAKIAGRPSLAPSDCALASPPKLWHKIIAPFQRLSLLKSDAPALSAQSTTADPWLTMRDVFGESTHPSRMEWTNSASSDLHITRPLGLPPTHYSTQLSTNVQRVFQWIQRSVLQIVPWSDASSKSGKLQPSVSRDLSRATRMTKSTTPRNAKRKEQWVVALSTATVSSTEMAMAGGSASSFIHQPTWLEAQASVIGYVKHPLEQLLEWLDQGLMWVEVTISTLWHAVQPLLDLGSSPEATISDYGKTFWGRLATLFNRSSTWAWALCKKLWQSGKA
jgi:hypothetical protein